MTPRPILVAAIGSALLAACQTARPPADDPAGAYTLSVRLADLIGQCWFAGSDPAFAELMYSPERNVDQSRILIVRNSDPTGLPLMVVEPKNATIVDVYGPLASDSDGQRLRADIARWTRGSDGCST